MIITTEHPEAKHLHIFIDGKPLHGVVYASLLEGMAAGREIYKDADDKWQVVTDDCWRPVLYAKSGRIEARHAVTGKVYRSTCELQANDGKPYVGTFDRLLHEEYPDLYPVD